MAGFRDVTTAVSAICVTHSAELYGSKHLLSQQPFEGLLELSLQKLLEIHLNRGTSMPDANKR